MRKRQPGIYKITCLPTGKVYVGSSVNTKNRWTDHQRDLLRHSHKNQHLQNAWEKYGEKEFVFSVIEEIIDVQNLIPREQDWIDKLDSANPLKGFNLSAIAGSTLGYKTTEATKEKLRLNRLGKKASSETKHLMSLARRGSKNNLAKLTEAEVEKIRLELSEGEKVSIVAKKYNVSNALINNIKLGRIWKNLPTLSWEHHREQKLDSYKVQQIREHLHSGMTCKSVGVIFGVSESTIYEIKRGLIWKHIPTDIKFSYGHRKGTGVHLSKLDDNKVKQIKIHLKNGMIYKDIGAIFSVSKGAIQAIKQGRTWKHITE